MNKLNKELIKRIAEVTTTNQSANDTAVRLYLKPLGGPCEFGPHVKFHAVARQRWILYVELWVRNKMDLENANKEAAR